MQPLLICTDLDRTLLPNGTPAESPAARSTFARLVSHPEICLAYVSGRNSTLIQAAIQEYQLPSPDWAIGDVGTTMYRVHPDGWEYWQSWEHEIASDWGGATAADLQPLFSELGGLQLQAPEQQSRYKLSYYLPLTADIDALRETMTERLDLQGIAASWIYSVDEAEAIGLVDILPARATKLHAVEFLMRQQGFGHNNTVFAGDSGNDLPVLASAVPAVLVANSHPDVIAQAQQQSQQQGNSDYFYLAHGNFRDMNGNYSAGILEGVAHYHPDTQALMQSDPKSTAASNKS